MNNGLSGSAAGILTGFNAYSAVFRILLAAVMGGCIGFQRGHRGRPAGLRTHILVCVGSALTVLCGLYAAESIGLDADPLRISAQVVSGIGFLGAGTILTNNRSHITGLTTAAGIWTTACIGIAAGLGFYLAAAVTFIAVMISITMLSRLESKQNKGTPVTYYIEVSGAEYVNALCDTLTGRGGRVQITAAKSGLADHVGIVCTASERGCGDEMLRLLRQAEGAVISVPMN